MQLIGHPSGVRHWEEPQSVVCHRGTIQSVLLTIKILISIKHALTDWYPQISRC